MSADDRLTYLAILNLGECKAIQQLIIEESEANQDEQARSHMDFLQYAKFIALVGQEDSNYGVTLYKKDAVVAHCVRHLVVAELETTECKKQGCLYHSLLSQANDKLALGLLCMGADPTLSQGGT